MVTKMKQMQIILLSLNNNIQLSAMKNQMLMGKLM